MIVKKLLLNAGLLVLFVSCQEQKVNKEVVESQELNIYTSRHYDADKSLIKEFEKTYGITVNVKKDKDDKLIALLQNEDSLTHADLLFMADAGRLCYAKKLGLLQSIESDSLEKFVAPQLKDEEGFWYGLTKRARVLVYSNERVADTLLSTYDHLATSVWAGKLVSRSSSNIYNQSLVASLIHNLGDSGAVSFLSGYVGNLQGGPSGNDRDQIKKIASGKGDVALVNTYYIGKMINSKDEMEKKAVSHVEVFFPNQNSTGAHVNVSGGGVTKYAKNKENAVKFLEFLISKSSQAQFAQANFEYPVRDGVDWHPVLKSWGDFKEDTLSMSVLGELNLKAIELMQTSGWE